MHIRKDESGTIKLIDNFSPAGIIVFDVYNKNWVSVYQDSDDAVTRDRFEAIDAAVEFDKFDLIKGLEQIVEELKNV